MDCLHYYLTILMDRVEAGDITAQDIVRFLKPAIAYGHDAGTLDEDARDVRLNCTDEFMELRRTAVQDDLRRVRERRETERARGE